MAVLGPDSPLGVLTRRIALFPAAIGFAGIVVTVAIGTHIDPFQ